MANLIDLNETTSMLEAINTTPRPKSFLRDKLFGGRSRNITASNVTVDYINGLQVPAPFVSPKVGYRHVERPDMVTRTWSFPLIAPLDSFTEDMAFQRMAGEVIGGGMSPEERDRRDRVTRLAEIDALITRREEIMIAELVTTGIITISGDGVSDTFTPGWDSANLDIDVSGGAADWDTGGSKNPTKDLMTWKSTIARLSGIVPDTCVMPLTTATFFLNDTKVQALLDKQNINIGNINVQDIDGGYYLGNIVGLNIYVYDEQYVNESATAVPLLAADTLVIFPSAGRVPQQTILYGAYHDVSRQVTLVGSRIPITWTDEAANVRYTKMLSKPIPFLPNLKSWLKAEVS